MSEFNSARFLDHHWFMNALVPFQEGHSDEHPPYTLSNLNVQKTLERVASCHSSGKLSEALQDIPDDILLFLSRYILPAVAMARKLEKTEFREYYRDVDKILSDLMEKYGAS